MTAHPLIYLASQSARRRQLLGHLGVPFEPLDSEVEESPQAGERPQDMVLRLAADKARAGLNLLQERRNRGEEIVPGSVVLAADTLVDLDGRPLGKPRNVEEAKQMLTALSGRSHNILTAVAVVGLDDALSSNTNSDASRPGRQTVPYCLAKPNIPTTQLAATEVLMRPPAPGWIDYCAAHPEALRSAGGYAVQGAAAPMVEAINGCFYCIVGLPLAVTAHLLHQHGITFRPELASPGGAFGTP